MICDAINLGLSKKKFSPIGILIFSDIPSDASSSDDSVPFNDLPLVALREPDNVVFGCSMVGNNVCIPSICAFSVATTALPPPVDTEASAFVVVVIV